MLNVEQTIISQYGSGATITRLIRDMNTHIDPRADIDAFYSYVWNVETAQGFGLDIWGRIVGISRALKIPDTPDYFGFNEATGSAHSFGESPFYAGAEPATQTYLLGDDAYRQLILVKALANISATDAPTINQLLRNMFAGRGRTYVVDLGGMALRYTFEFDLTPYEFAIITQAGALPRPAGVSTSMFSSATPLFGFSEAAGAAPFGEGIFVPQGALNATI